MSKHTTILMLVALAVGLMRIPHFLPRVIPLGTVETIQGIPYPEREGHLVILEPLAHVDAHVEHVLARQLTLTFSFIPANVPQLSVGVRENPFWLSYRRHIFYEASSEGLPPTEARQVSVTLPLTDTLKDHDGTVDVMFFAGTEDAITLAESLPSSVQWEFFALTARTSFAWPTIPQVRDYARALLSRERPL